MSELNVGKVNVIDCDSFDDALKRAGTEATNTAGMSLPVVMFHQGNRLNLSGALYLGFVANRLRWTPLSRPKKCLP